MKPATQVLIERYQKHLYAIAFNICRNQQDAEDVVQDTFIQYHTYKKELDRKSTRLNSSHPSSSRMPSSA